MALPLFAASNAVHHLKTAFEAAVHRVHTPQTLMITNSLHHLYLHGRNRMSFWFLFQDGALPVRTGTHEAALRAPEHNRTTLMARAVANMPR